MNIIFVMIGGFFGSLSRFALGEWIHINDSFPIGTFTINLLGCFALGWFFTFMKQKKIMTDRINILIGTGFIGSFTTFSTFSVETIQLMEKVYFIQAILYVLSSVLLGIVATYLGWKLAASHAKKGDTV